MKLRITTPESTGFKHGSAARLSLDGTDVSPHVSRIVLTVDAEDAIRAEIMLYPSVLDIELPASVRLALDQKDGIS